MADDWEQVSGQRRVAGGAALAALDGLPRPDACANCPQLTRTWQQAVLQF